MMITNTAVDGLDTLLTPRQRRLLEDHLRRRLEKQSPKAGLSIVYDITHACNLRCLGCCVSAHYFRPCRDRRDMLLKPSTAEVLKVLRKVRDYLDTHPDTPFFLNFGGGEIFMRPDMFDVLEEASRLFGSDSACPERSRRIGFDTNGTLITAEEVARIAPQVSYIGVSLDGLAGYHNEWRGPSSLALSSVEGVSLPVNGSKDPGDSFHHTVTFIRRALLIPEIADKLEVTTVVTRHNLDQVPDLMRFLKDIGVQKYSIHRTMLVGRFADPALVPDGPAYLRLFVAVLEANEELGLDVHLHHSLESIYATLLLGHDTYAADKLSYPDRRSSLGIGPTGEVFFDPWCMVPPWTMLSGGSLLDDGVTLEKIIHRNGGGMLEMARAYCGRHVRCLGCHQSCSGGSRVAAAAHYLSKNGGLSPNRVTENHLLAGLAQVDPACPLYWNGGLSNS